MVKELALPHKPKGCDDPFDQLLVLCVDSEAHTKPPSGIHKSLILV
jgi:hypothetical protein